MKIRKDGSLLWRQLDDEVIALDMQESVYLRLNQTGTVLWQQLQEPVTRQDLVETLIEKYEIDEAQAGADVDAFLDSLERSGLLEKE